VRLALVVAVALVGLAACRSSGNASRADKCTDRILQKSAPVHFPVTKAQVRHYIAVTYCDRFARKGWVYADGALSIDAQHWLNCVTTAVQTGAHVDPKTAKTTVDQSCTTWLGGYATRRPSTVRQAEVHVKQIKAAFGWMSLAAVRPSHVKSWTAKLKSNGLSTSYIYALIASGADVKVVQARLRHASAKTTLDTYSHMWPDADESARAAIGAVLAARADFLRTNA